MQKEWSPLSGAAAFAPPGTPALPIPTSRGYPQTLRGQSAIVATTETTTSTSYVDLTTVGPQIEIAAGPSGMLYVHIACAMRTTVATGCFMSFTFTGGVATAAADSFGLQSDGGNVRYRFGGSHLITDLGASLVTVTCKYRAGAGATAEFRDRTLIVIPL